MTPTASKVKKYLSDEISQLIAISMRKTPTSDQTAPAIKTSTFLFLAEKVFVVGFVCGCYNFGRHLS